MTDLINAEINRLETEFASRCQRQVGHLDTPVRTSLNILAYSFLKSSGPFLPDNIKELLLHADVDESLIDKLLEFLENYGILHVQREAGDTPFSTQRLLYQPGSRHLWDYFIALIFITDNSLSIGNLLPEHMDSANMYAILLIEREGRLPLDCEELIETCGEKRTRSLTLHALATAAPPSAGKFKTWVFDELKLGKGHFLDIVNDIVIRVADESEHPLGPMLLNKFLKSFGSPAARDIAWSLPEYRPSSRGLSIYKERDLLEYMPSLHDDSKHSQMPLVFAWMLASVSNLKRSYCRGELVKWGLANPLEFSKLFAMFCSSDDPQIRKDMYAIAEKIVCQGNLPSETETAIGKLAFSSAFVEPDKPGNRDAGTRYYGRILIEHCIADGVMGEEFGKLCRPPYTLSPDDSPLQIFPEACKATRMDGYGQIHYDLARYVLVDHLECAFGLHYYRKKRSSDKQYLEQLIANSASNANVEIPGFEGWVIAAAYQYLVDHGYDPERFEGPLDENGYRVDGIDHEIARSFGQADHGSRSIVMTVAEKYVWCARNEICGYLADRIPADEIPGFNDDCQYCNDSGLSLDYGLLLDFDSPLLEASVRDLTDARRDIQPSFPQPFSCDGDIVPCSEDELRTWISETPATAAYFLLDYIPEVDLSLRGDIIPIALYAYDWSPSGKSSMTWINAGVIGSDELKELESAPNVHLDGYSRSSDFVTGIARSMCVPYISPVEYLASPWTHEEEANKAAETEVDGSVNLHALPLSGSGVSNLSDIGDYWYYFPSAYRRKICKVVRTDGAHYFDGEGNIMFEDVKFGTEYRHGYQGLLADRIALLEALAENGNSIVWYATVQRTANALATERLHKFDDVVEKSWLIWIDVDGKFRSCPVSNKEIGSIRNPMDSTI